MADEAGVNKPFDRILKSFADDAPRLLLQLVGIVGPGEIVEIDALRPETAPPVAMPDLVVLLRFPGRKSIFHAEFLLYYVASSISGVARYGGSLAQQHGLDVESILVLLRPDGVPETFPEVAEYRVGNTRVLHPFRVVRMWELDPAPVLATGDARLFPWAVLMKSTDEQVREIGRLVSELGDEEAIGRFLTLGSVRYDRDQLEAMIGGTGMGLTEAILQGSSLVRDITDKASRASLAQGLEQGLARGREEGKLVQTRRILRAALEERFPGLEALPEIDAIPTVEALETVLIDQVLKSASRQSVETALRLAGSEG